MSFLQILVGLFMPFPRWSIKLFLLRVNKPSMHIPFKKKKKVYGRYMDGDEDDEEEERIFRRVIKWKYEDDYNDYNHRSINGTMLSNSLPSTLAFLSPSF